MESIRATEDLVIELWPGGELSEQPLLKVKSLAGERNEEPQTVIVHLSEVPALRSALAEAAALLAAMEGGEHEETSFDWAVTDPPWPQLA
ncbi:MAG: hypothetical protein GTO49_08210 [Anaerolineae bacterium]|nr:hypothetical protein [Anaerolineae bacterium]